MDLRMRGKYNMSPHDNGKIMDHRSSSENDPILHDEIMHGLLAARHYERNRPRLPLAVRDALIQKHFPRLLPEAAEDNSGNGNDNGNGNGNDNNMIIHQLTKDEYADLRMSMQEMAGKETRNTIAKLQEQLIEYHSVLDRLSTMTTKYEALERHCQERGERITSLEQEVALLKLNTDCRTEHWLRSGDADTFVGTRRSSDTAAPGVPGGWSCREQLQRRLGLTSVPPNESSYTHTNQNHYQFPGCLLDMSTSQVEHQNLSLLSRANRHRYQPSSSNGGGVHPKEHILPENNHNQFRQVDEPMSAKFPNTAEDRSLQLPSSMPRPINNSNVELLDKTENSRSSDTSRRSSSDSCNSQKRYKSGKQQNEITEYDWQHFQQRDMSSPWGNTNDSSKIRNDSSVVRGATSRTEAVPTSKSQII